MKTPAALLPLLALTLACASSRQPSMAETNAVHEAAQTFLDVVHAFDYEAMREGASDDFEILIFGQRMDLDAFEALLRDMEADRGGRSLNFYELEDFHTEIRGDVAYTSWSSPRWLEAAVLVREDGRWLMARAASIRKRRSEEP